MVYKSVNDLNGIIIPRTESYSQIHIHGRTSKFKFGNFTHRQSQNMKILYDPRPRTTEEIFSEEDNARFFSDHEIFQIDEDNAEQQYSAWLPKIDIIISQQNLD